MFIPVFLLVLMLLVALPTAFGIRKIRKLKNIRPVEGPLPHLSAIVPIRNEEEHLEVACRSLLSQDYPNYEVICVDDRSTDRTPEILRKLSSEFPGLRVVRIETLPKGWLGKNHALQKGAESAKGEFLLFTDADISMEKTVFRRAVGLLVSEKADHLAILPDGFTPSFFTRVLYDFFVVSFHVFTQSWKVEKPGKHSVGVGAFNLVRTSAYKRAGTHAALSLKVDDDLKLGQILKKTGHVARILDGFGLVRFPFYPSLKAAFLGFEKNFFAGLNFSIFAAALSIVAMFTLYDWPLLGVLLTSPPEQFVYLGLVAFQLFFFAMTNSYFGLNPWRAVFYPLGGLIFLGIGIWSTAVTLLRGGVRWRNTFYSMKELKSP